MAGRVLVVAMSCAGHGPASQTVIGTKIGTLEGVSKGGWPPFARGPGGKPPAKHPEGGRVGKAPRVFDLS